jgi:hypothetical protein
MVKMEFHFFILFLKLIQAKIFSIIDFQGFFNGAHFSSFEIRQIKERYSLYHKELRSVEIFKLYLMDVEI